MPLLLLLLLLLLLPSLVAASGKEAYERNFGVASRVGSTGHFMRLDANDNAAVQKKCGIPDTASTKPATQPTEQYKVFHGTPAFNKDHPWAVALTYNGRQFCSGTLISPIHVVSAVHCFIETPDGVPCTGPKHKFKPPFQWDGDLNLFKVMLGGECTSKDICQRGQVSTVSTGIRRVALDLRYVSSGECEFYDFALVELDTPVKATPICLPPARIEYAIDESLAYTHVAYGVQTEVKEPDHKGNLQKFTANVIECTDAHGPEGQLVCTQNPKDLNKEICEGDSGGTLETTDKSSGRVVLVGVHSYAGTCELDNEGESASVDVRNYLDVICHVIGVCHIQ